MSEITTFEKLEGGKNFIVIETSSTIFKDVDKDCVFLKFVPQVRSLPYNCMRLHDQKMFEIREDTKVKEVFVW